MPTLIAPLSGSSYKLAPADTHLARCVSMVDLGTHTDTYMGEPKWARKIRLSFELPNELEVFDEVKGKQPYMVSREFTFSMHEKATLRAFLQNWRGKAFTDKETREFDLAKLIGQPAMLTVIHHTSQTGKVSAKITAAAKPLKGVQCPAQITPSLLFSLSEFEQDAYEVLPEFLRLKIADSEEYKALSKSGQGGAKAVADDDDDIPF